MDKYKFNSSGTQLLELAMVVLSNIGESSWMFINGSRTNFGSLVDTTETFDSRIYSSQEDFIKMLDCLRSGEHDIIEDAQKIVKMFQNTDDIEGQKFLINIVNGIDKNKIVGSKLRFDLHMCKLYHGFLYKDGHVGRGFRMNNPAINKSLLIHVLEVTNPEVESDFKVLVDNAENLGIPDEDIEKIYKMLRYKYSKNIGSEWGADFNDSPFARANRFEIMQKSFAPVQERLEIKKQQAQQAQLSTDESQITDEEYEPRTLEEALELIRKLRTENRNLKKQNAVLDGIIKAQQLRHTSGENVYVPQERVVQTI